MDTTSPNGLTLNDWRRSLRSQNRSKNTIRNYLGAAEAFADHLGGADLLLASRRDVQAFIGSILDSGLSASTAASRFRGLQQLYRWALEEDLIERSPMDGMKPPTIPEKLVPIIRDDDLRLLLKACDGKGFTERRDMALIRLMLEPGGLRLGEVTGLTLADVNLDDDTVGVIGKGQRPRVVPFGSRTGQAITRYLRERAKHPQARHHAALWLGKYGPLTDSGIAQMLERRSLAAGIGKIHPHQLRHTAAHLWLAVSRGDETSAMRLFGWKTRQMLQRYGASAADERAREAARQLNLGDRL